MKPYYQDETTILYNGDVLEVLNNMRIAPSAIITDPPFSSGSRTDAGKAMRGGMRRGSRWSDEWFSHDNMATHGFMFLMRLVCSALHRASAHPASCSMFIDWRMYPNLYGALESAGWVAKNMVVWDKKHFGMGTNFRNQHELLIYAEKGQVNFLRHDIANVLSCSKPSSEWHPTEKPVELLSTIISCVTSQGDTVLDPFAGSGSTLVAAKQMGRKSVGIEIDEQHCQNAVKRLSQEVLAL